MTSTTTTTNTTDTSSSRRGRVAALALAAGIAAAGFSVNPATTAQAAATNQIRTKDNGQATKLRERIAQIAKEQKGDRYVLGATGPAAFDCSGLVQYAYKRATGKTLPRTSYQLASAVDRVKPKNRKVGDIVFYRGNGHVGIYIGKGRVAHALNPGAGVLVQPTSEGWNRSMIYGYGRVIKPR